jgi:pyochelin biosynthetic protein PchC
MGGWLRRHTSHGDRAAHRLVCLPHAGGTARTFETWPHRLPADVETVVVQYPGRQDRISEDCIDHMDEMAAGLMAELGELTDLPMSMFGHSMGSAIAYEVARLFERDLGVVMHTIFVSARTAPHRWQGEEIHHLDDDSLVAAIRALGGPDGDVYDLPKLWPLILPPLRSDLRLLDKYRPATLTRLRAPFVAFGGAEDHTCPIGDLDAWNDATMAGIEVHTLPGGHHFLAVNEAAIIAAIVRHLAAESATPDRRPQGFQRSIP